MGFCEKLSKVLPESLSVIISLEVLKLHETVGNEISLSRGYRHIKGMIESYTLGRRTGNLYSMMERNRFVLKKNEMNLLNSDLDTFREEYFKDSEDNFRKNVIKAENPETLDTHNFFYEVAKIGLVERNLEADYIDRWIKYNKLFSNA